jgi:hypothetical protein
MANMRPLETKIADAFTAKRVTIPVLEALSTELEAGIEAATANVKKLREAVLDPIAYPNRTEAKAAIDDAEFALSRLLTLRPRLSRRMQQVEQRHIHALWYQDFRKVEAQRDKAVEQFRERYPALINELLELLHTTRQVDAECARVDRSAPVNEPRRLLGVELTARGLHTFTTAEPEIADNIVLPDSRGARLLWPPPPQNPSLLLSVPPADPRFGSDWGVHRAEQETIAREQAEREREAKHDHAVAEAKRRGGGADWWCRGETAKTNGAKTNGAANAHDD